MNKKELAKHYKKRIKDISNSLFKEYKSGKTSYSEYFFKLSKFLKGKTEEQWYHYYNSYIKNSKDRLDKLDKPRKLYSEHSNILLILIIIGFTLGILLFNNYTGYVIYEGVGEEIREINLTINKSQYYNLSLDFNPGSFKISGYAIGDDFEVYLKDKERFLIMKGSNLTLNKTKRISFSEFCIETCNLVNVSKNITLEFYVNQSLLKIEQISYTKYKESDIDKSVNITAITILENETQFRAIINEPVKWVKQISIKNNENKSKIIRINVSLPKDAINIKLNDFSVKEIYEIKENLTSFEEKKYYINYETIAPLAIESNVSITDKWRKNITILSNASIHYRNILSYSNIKESRKEQIHLYLSNDSKIEITEDKRYNLSFVDTNNNSLIDKIYWNIPILSEQKFLIEIDLNVIDVQSHPTLFGNWTIRFSTIGIANLTIRAVNGTSFAEIPDDNSTEDDLEFLSLKCSNSSLNITFIYAENSSRIEALFYPNYSCANATLVNKVLTFGEHILEFKFGDILEYASNLVNVMPIKDLIVFSDRNKTKTKTFS